MQKARRSIHRKPKESTQQTLSSLRKSMDVIISSGRSSFRLTSSRRVTEASTPRSPRKESLRSVFPISIANEPNQPLEFIDKAAGAAADSDMMNPSSGHTSAAITALLTETIPTTDTAVDNIGDATSFTSPVINSIPIGFYVQPSSKRSRSQSMRITSPEIAANGNVSSRGIGIDFGLTYSHKSCSNSIVPAPAPHFTDLELEIQSIHEHEQQPQQPSSSNERRHEHWSNDSTPVVSTARSDPTPVVSTDCSDPQKSNTWSPSMINIQTDPLSEGEGEGNGHQRRLHLD